MIDVLSDVLDTVALKGTLYFHADFRGPFAIAVPVFLQAARFHFVVRGQPSREKNFPRGLRMSNPMRKMNSMISTGDRS